jgi:uncharacterized damage-inducible protein DinB
MPLSPTSHAMSLQRIDHMRLMAQYNQWMNGKLYAAAATLPHAAVLQDRGAFFGSLLGTLNHLAVADIIWLKRLAHGLEGHAELDPVRAMAMPAALNAVVCDTLPALHELRVKLDNALLALAAALAEEELDRVIEYKTMAGIPGSDSLYVLLLHVFNHQTHHRGQASTLLTQSGVDVGVTDLLALVRENKARAA